MPQLVSPGSVLLSLPVILAAIYLNDDPKQWSEASPEAKFYAFSCLLQIMESLILHDSIYYDASTAEAKEGSTILKTYQIRHSADDSKDQEWLSAFHSLPLALMSSERKTTIILDSSADSNIKNLVTTLSPQNFDPESIKKAPVKGPFSTDALGLAVVLPPGTEPFTYFPGYASMALGKIKDKVGSEITEMNKWLNEARFNVELPIIAHYVLTQRQFSAKSSLLLEAFKIRHTKEAVAFRKVCAEFDQAARIGDNKTLYRLKRELEAAADQINRRFQQPTSELAIEFPWSISVPLSPLLEKIGRYRKRHLLFVGKLYEAAIEQEGLRREYFKHF